MALREFGYLVYNEAEKLYRKKRLLVIILTLMAIIPIFVYAQYSQSKTQQEKLGTKDWHIVLQQDITDTQNRLTNARIPDEFKRFLEFRVKQQQYYLDKDINPNAPGAPSFVKGFMENGISLFIPLFVMVLTIDLISGERSDGTIKVLLTRPVKRWKILLSKFVTMLLFVSLLNLIIGILAYLISGIVFGFSGWGMPILTGFSIKGPILSMENVHAIPLWKYNLIAYGFGWFVCITVGTIALMVSVLIRSTPAGLGVILAALIAGGILSGFATSWEGAKYLFSVNLQITDYLAGKPKLLEGLTFQFALWNLTIWATVSAIIAFFVFIRQDMLS